MPSDAKLYADGRPVSLDRGNSFRTPPLEPGEDYVYTLKVETVIGNRIVSKSKQVYVRAGRTSQVAFEGLRLPPEGDKGPARIVADLPDNATLFVNGVKSPVHTFSTPTLAPGKYTYTLKAQMVKEGRTVSETKNVMFRAGERVIVRFDTMTPVQTARR